MLSKNQKFLKSQINIFIKKYLKNFDYIYLTSDLRGFIYKFKINPNLICKTLFDQFRLYLKQALRYFCLKYKLF